MRNDLDSGEILTLTAPSGGVVSGGAYKIGSLVVVATAPAAEGDPFEALTEGVCRLPKPDQEEWAEADKIYFDESEAKFTTDDDGAANALVGVAAAVVSAAIELATDAEEGDLDVGENGNTFEVGDYSALSGKTVTLTINGRPPVVLTEGVDFDAEDDNDTTASNLANAINSLVAGAQADAYLATVTVATSTADPATGPVRLDGVAR